jgi:uncharacterized protein YneF (UPF0154 family)
MRTLFIILAVGFALCLGILIGEFNEARYYQTTQKSPVAEVQVHGGGSSVPWAGE